MNSMNVAMVTQGYGDLCRCITQKQLIETLLKVLDIKAHKSNAPN